MFLKKRWSLLLLKHLRQTAKFQFIGEREQKITLPFCVYTTITPLRANIVQIQIIPYYPLTKRAKRDI